MYCGLVLRRVLATRLTQDENEDEIYFAYSGGAPNNISPRREVRRGWGQADPDVWVLRQNEAIFNIVIWQDFIPDNMSATLNVELREQVFIGEDDFVGSFNVTIRAQFPNPVIEWSAASNDTTIVGATSGETVTIFAEGAGASYEVIASIERSRTITNVNSHKCLDVADGLLTDNANVQQFTCLGNSNQRWFIMKTGHEQARGLPFPNTGAFPNSRGFFCFAILNDHSGKCLDVEAAGSFRNVQQFTHFRGTPQQNQKWFLIPTETAGEFFIVFQFNVGQNFGLDVAGASLSENANVQIFEFHGGANQRWRISPLPFALSTFEDDFFSYL